MTANMISELRFAGPFAMLSNCNLWLALDEGVSEARAPHPLDLPPDLQLTANDLRRWQRFRTVEKQRQFLLSRVAVDEVLRREIDDRSVAVRFVADASGRPMVVSNDDQEVRQISLSHSGPVTAVVISSEIHSIGVDVEIVEPVHTAALRSMVEHPGDHEFRTIARDANESEYLRTLWTIKESVWKSLGGGHPISVTDISVQIRDGELRPTLTCDSHSSADFSVQLFSINCSPIVLNTRQLNFDNASKTACRGCVAQNVTHRESQIAVLVQRKL